MDHNTMFHQMVEELACEDPDRLNGLLRPQAVSCDYEGGLTEIAFQVKPWQRNPYDDAHGGAIASMLDTASGFTAYWIADRNRVTTVDLAINYISPMPCGDRMIVRSKVQKAGRTLIRITSEAFSEAGGKLIATATANFMILR